MFYLLSNEKPTKKVLLVGTYKGHYVEYMATRTKEVVNVYVDDTKKKCVASYYSKVALIEVDGESQDTSEVTVGGKDWSSFLELIGVYENGEKIEGVVHYSHFDFIQKIGTSNVNKIKDFNYILLNGGKSDVMAKIGFNNSIEDYLYQSRSVAEIVEEKQREYEEKGSHVEFNLDWVNEKDYRVLRTNAEIEEFFEALEQTDELVGFDTETTGLLVNRTKRDELVGLSMSFKHHTGYYFPLQHKRFDNVEMGMEEFLRRLKPYIDKNSAKRKGLIGHNIGFDYRVLKMYDIELNIVEDTYLKFSLVRIGQAKYVGALKEMVEKYLGYPVIELSDMYEKRNAQDIQLVKDAVLRHGVYVNPITHYKLERAKDFKDLKYDFRFASYEFTELYGSADADFPRLINDYINTLWDDELDFVYRMEIDLIPALVEQEYYGIKADMQAFDRLHEETLVKLEELEQKIYKEAGREFSVTSPKDKAEILFDVMGCPFLPRFKTKKGGRGTDKNVMDALSGYKTPEGEPMYPIVAMLQEYSKLSTLVSNFYSKLPTLIHDGYLFPSYKQMGAETGRMSCFNPNLQQTEKTSRKYMTTDSDDYYFLICDYSQVEYRIMAGMSGEEKVVNFFKNNPEADYHILAYANMMNKAYEDVTSAERKVGKKLNFGTTYGLEDANLALNLYGNDTKIHQMMAREARNLYFAGVPVLRDYFEEVRDEAQQKGYVRTMFGRRRDIEEFQYSGYISEYKIASGRRKAGNMPVQGTAADIMKMALTRLRNTFREQGWEEDMVRLVGNIHDEVIIQVHKSLNAWYVLSFVRKAMEIDLSDNGFPPLYIGANVGYSWSDGKVDELEAPVLLMDEKIAEVESLIESGVHYTELETWIDPRKMWDEEIRKFALRQVAKQIEEGKITNLEEAHKDGRLMKYSKHFGKNENNLIQYMLDGKGWEYVWVNIDAILEEPSVKLVVAEKPKKTSEVLEEEKESVDALVKKCLRYNSKANVLRVNLNHPDAEFVNALENMLVDNNATRIFKEETFYNIEIKVSEQSEVIKFQYKKLPKFFAPLLKKYTRLHVMGIPMTDYEQEIDEIGTKYIDETKV